MNLYLTLIRIFFRILSKVAPHLAGSLAFHLFQKPRTRAIRSIEKSFYEQVVSYKIETPIEAVDCYELGNKHGKLVILVHGWESNAGSLAAIAIVPQRSVRPRRLPRDGASQTRQFRQARTGKSAGPRAAGLPRQSHKR